MPSTRSQSRAEGNEGNAPAQPSQDPHKCIIKPSSSVRSGTSSQKQLKKINAEKRVLDDLAAAKLKILEETYQRKLQLEHEAIDLEDDICSKASYGMDGVADWVDNTMIETKRNLTPPLQPTIPSPPPQPAMHGSSGVSPPEAKPSDIKLLADALKTSMYQVNKESKLPVFDGKASDWLVFKGAYKEDEARLTRSENLLRLRVSLKGMARETINALLITGADPQEIMSTLELRFGNQFYIINEQLQILSSLPYVSAANVEGLAKFTCLINNSITTIKALKKQEHLYNPELYNAIIKKLDSITLNKWFDYADLIHCEENIPILETLLEFLKKETQRCIRFAPYSQFSYVPATYSTQLQPAANLSDAANIAQKERYSINATSSGMKTSNCLLCNGEHLLPNCDQFIKKTVDERYQWVKDNKLCFRCIIYKHAGKNCKISKYLHRLLRKDKNDEFLCNNKSSPTQAHQLNSCNNSNDSLHCKTYLKIVPVTITGPRKSVNTYALLDEGATITLINEQLAQEIGTDGIGSPLHLQGLGFSTVEHSKRVKLTISGKHNQSFDIHARTKKSLELGLQTIDRSEFLKYQHIKQLDNVIDWQTHSIPKILIGQDNWHLIVTREICAGKNSEPVASRTALGWVVHGCMTSLTSISNDQDQIKVNTVYKVSDCQKSIYKVINCQTLITSEYDQIRSNIASKVSNYENETFNNSDDENYKYKVSICQTSETSEYEENMFNKIAGVSNCENYEYRVPDSLNEHLPTGATKTNDDELFTLIKRSFDLDNLGIQPIVRSDPSEKRAVEILQSTTKRIDSTTWETGLLWKSDEITLPNEIYSYNMALKRFYILEKKLNRNPILCATYTEQMKKLFNNKFAITCRSQSRQYTGNKSWFLPHFAVINPNKPGKVRPVFDAAAKTVGTSLNDKLLTGPDLLQSLLGLLLKFRLKRIAVSADIRDMFLRIKIKKEDQEAQKFLWREPMDTGPPKVCKMTSMLFGTTCSPCSAIYVKDTNAQEFQTQFPESVQAILKNHYVDDYLDSLDSESEAIQRATEIIYIHSQGGFDIRSWASNSETVLKAIPEDKRAHESIDLTPEAGQKNKTLGMVWEPATDTLSFNMSMLRVPSKIATCKESPTKRQMLSVIMSVFDPIGLVTPLTIKGKILLQEVWRSKVNWDDKIEDKQYEKWKKWIQELSLVKECKIPRCYSPRLNAKVVHLHTFCDASEKAYVAACYLRYQYEDGEVKVVLVTSKAKVTPLKPISIPRLELQAALLGARLAKTVEDELGVRIDTKFFWSDSTTTLAWIRSDPRKFKPYVGHRLAAIDDLSSPNQWKWVPTAENVADIATRDVEACNFSPVNRWFIGPNFLYQQEELWPVEKITPRPAAEAIKEEKVHIMTQKVDFSVPDINRFSSLQRFIKTTASVLLFINKCKKTGDQQLTVDLLSKAENILIKKSQYDSYSKDISVLKNNSVLKESVLLQLCPYLDEDGMLRARGRIDRAPEVMETCRRPIILDHSHPYTKLLILDYHKRQNHASTETVLNEIKQRYYISKLRSTLRLVTHHCQVCKIRRATPSTPIMGDLPLCRLDHHKRPFTHCGLDYFGPIEVSIGRRREKRYGALFTCMVTRAVHMEIAASLTSDSVIMAIRRMICRRGYPTDLYSDNGTNFKGADAELKREWNALMKDEHLQQEIMNKKIKWHFIPATAANMGGAWERLVQSIKKALYATLNERTPREETLATLLVEAEHTVNSRPLTHVSDDVNDAEALTPNHFLLGSSSGVSLPGKFDDKDLMLRKQWKVAQRLADMFWQRWVKEYLPTLLPRTGSDCEKDLQTGDLVIVADSSLPRNMWPKGIVKSIHPGQDNRVRVVDVETTGGIFRRPANKVIRLPVEADCVYHS